MRTATLGSVLLVASSASLSGQATENVLWPIGCSAVTTSEVPRTNRLGTRSGWIADDASGTFVVKSDGDALAVEISKDTEHTSDSVSLLLTPDGVRAAARRSNSSGGEWLVRSLAGTACVVTDGNVAALEFELYDGAEAQVHEGYLGRVDLGATGVALAARLAARARQGPELRFEKQLLAGHERSGLASAGHVDALGRRQGLWIVRDPAREAPVLEMTWRDGIPDGPYLERADSVIDYRIGAFRRGFPDGDELVVRTDGERRLEPWVDGRLHGESVRLHASGRRIGATRYENGLQVGPTRSFSFGGEVIDEHPGPHPQVGILAEMREGRWREFRAELAAFHTRR